jgi:hypothetical protein
MEVLTLLFLPPPAVSRDRKCFTRAGEKRKRKIGGGEPQKSIFIKKSGPIKFTGNYCSSDLY